MPHDNNDKTVFQILLNFSSNLQNRYIFKLLEKELNTKMPIRHEKVSVQDTPNVVRKMSNLFTFATALVRKNVKFFESFWTVWRLKCIGEIFVAYLLHFAHQFLINLLLYISTECVMDSDMIHFISFVLFIYLVKLGYGGSVLGSSQAKIIVSLC